MEANNAEHRKDSDGFWGTVSESDSDAREEKAMSFYGRLWGAVFKYYLNAIDEANAGWQPAEYEEAMTFTGGS